MPTRNLILFEDEGAGRFEPVALTRSVASLRSGVWTHRERWEHLLPGRPLGLVARGYLADIEGASGGWAFVNDPPPAADSTFVSAALGHPTTEGLEAVRDLEPGCALLSEGRLVAARATGVAALCLSGLLVDVAGDGPWPAPGAPDWPRQLAELGLRPTDVSARLHTGLVELMATNGATIDADFENFGDLLPAPDAGAFPGVHILGGERIRLAEGVRLEPGVVLDAREGAILLGSGTSIGANSVLVGPVVTGPDCLVRPLSRVTGGVTLGPVCRVGGEVDSTIVQGWSNKQHDGFLGHSYVGSWVNLGAATDTSDLKNDYGPVRIMLGGERVDTGNAHVGSLIGDHSKTGIHTQLNTGTVIGVSSNVFGAGVPVSEVPSFSWGGGRDWQEYRLEKAIRVARTVTSRRGIDFLGADERVFERIHEDSTERRRICHAR